MTTEKIEVLLVEDDIDYASLLHLRLARAKKQSSRLPEVEIHHVHSLADAKTALDRGSYDLALLDLTLPDSRGLKTLESLCAHAPSLAIIVLTVDDDDDTAMTAIEMGALDYFIKDEINISLLLRAMRHALKRADMLVSLRSQHIEQLQAREENLRSVVTQLADGIAVLDHKRHVQYVNPTLLILLERTKRDIVGHEFRFPVKLGETLEIELHSSTGEARILEMRGSDVTWHGEPACLVLVRDISTQKRAARAMEQYARELEVRNEDLNAFAHTVAHNLKAPLTHVILAADLLELNSSKMNEEFVPYVKSIVNYGRKTTDIIDELLLLAEVRSRDDLLLLPLQMEQIVHDVEARLNTLFSQNNARLLFETNAENWPTVIGYAPWIEEVWANYLTNAVKYGGHPPVLKIGSKAQSNGMVKFWVRDNGEGIQPEDRRALFQPFARLKPYSTDGHGLGLSIVRRIIEKLGGDVGVESTPGEGSVFYFTLPSVI